jgi:hypothetical protein
MGRHQFIQASDHRCIDITLADLEEAVECIGLAAQESALLTV